MAELLTAKYDADKLPQGKLRYYLIIYPYLLLSHHLTSIGYNQKQKTSFFFFLFSFYTVLRYVKDINSSASKPKTKPNRA